MTQMTALTRPAPSGSYRSFPDEAVTRRAKRLGRKEANRRKHNDLLAALVLAGAVFSATTGPALLIGGGHFHSADGGLRGGWTALGTLVPGRNRAQGAGWAKGAGRLQLAPDVVPQRPGPVRVRSDGQGCPEFPGG